MTKKCKVEVFSRVTGFFRPVQSWNKGKAAEFGDRKKFNIDTVHKKKLITIVAGAPDITLIKPTKE